MGKLYTTDDSAILATVLGFKLLAPEWRRQLNASARTVLAPEFKRAVDSHARTRTDQRVLVQGSRVTGGNPPVLVAASSRRRLSGGLVPDQDGAAQEFGTLDRNRRTTYTRKGRKVTRRTRRQLPARVRSGRVVMPAVADVVPRITSLWVQQFVRLVYKAAGE